MPRLRALTRRRVWRAVILAVAIGLILVASALSRGNTWILVRGLISLIEFAAFVIAAMLVLRSLAKLAAETYARERARWDERHSQNR